MHVKPVEAYCQSAVSHYTRWLRLLQVSTTLGPEIQLTICLPHACVAIVAALTESGESQTLLLSMFRVP